jgi:hypothetical protein
MGPLPIWTGAAAQARTWVQSLYNISLAPDELTSFGYCA